MDIPSIKFKPKIPRLSSIKKLRPRRRHLRYVWVGLVLLAGISFLVGQVAIYLSSSFR